MEEQLPAKRKELAPLVWHERVLEILELAKDVTRAAQVLEAAISALEAEE